MGVTQYLYDQNIDAIRRMTELDENHAVQEALRTRNQAAIAQLDALIRVYVDGINRLRLHGGLYHGVAYRGLEIHGAAHERFLTYCAPGAILHDPGFLSADKYPPSHGTVVLAIQSITGVDIDWIRHPKRDEHEIVWLPMAPLKILGRQRQSNGAITIFCLC